MESDNVSMCQNVFVTEAQEEKTEQKENGEVKNAPLTEEPVKSQNVGNIPSLDKFLAVDCEMVGVGKNKSRLARISLVDSAGNTLLDSFVAVAEKVTNYRTKFSGVRPKNLAKAESFDTVMKKVRGLLRDKIIVCHSPENDFKAMDYYPPHPEVNTRDTAQYFKEGKKKPSLKGLVHKHLGKSIQSGEHSSVEDARATMEIYVKFRDEWEESLINPKVVKQNKEQEIKDPLARGKKFEILSKLPTDHVFQSSDFSDATKKNNTIKVEWAEVWIQRRSDRPDYTCNAGAGKNDNMGILEAFNQLSNQQLREWIDSLKVDGSPSTTINNNIQPLSVKAGGKKFNKLSKLPPNHVFKRSDFSDGTKRNNNVKVQWAEVWIQRRSDRPRPDIVSMGILEAFNQLSNKQLREWIDYLKVDERRLTYEGKNIKH